MSVRDDVLVVEDASYAYLGRFPALDKVSLRVGRAGKTIVLATHDLASLETLAERCVVLGEDHRIVADGSTHDILTDRDLLLAVNLIHEHAHSHGALAHTHEHDATHHDPTDH